MVSRAGLGALAVVVALGWYATGTGSQVRPPRAGAVFDYQLGGPYPPASGVQAVSRDRTAEPAAGRYNVCYVNAFQAQPGEEHPRLLLRDGSGAPVEDTEWDEPLFDISTPARREALLRTVGPWIDGCADAGFDAVEPDNLDSWERSRGLLSSRDAEEFARLVAGRAHARGLAVAQKNTAGLLGARGRIGFDFAVVEECARYGECAAFDRAYDGRVLAVEYDRAAFTAGCKAPGERAPLTLRDPDVTPEGAPGHVRRHC